MHRPVLCAVIALMCSFIMDGASAEAAPLADDPVPVEGCGPTLSKPEGGTWECTFADNFDGRSLDRTKWIPQVDFASGVPSARACNVDDPSNIAVRNGGLKLTVRKLQAPIICRGSPAQYTSGSVSTHHRFSQQYGRFESRFKVASTTVPGLQEAFWLWPDDRVPSDALWPAAGEIDVVETYSQYYWLAIPFLHYGSGGGPRPGVNTSWKCEAWRGVYNTYILTWTSTTLTIDVNGTTCLVNTSGDVAFQKPYIAAFTSALGTGTNPLTDGSALPATMSVDYLRVWR